MNFRNISAWSIRNPIIPIVLFMGLLLAGIVSFSRMDVNNDPDIDFPAVTVNISQPGAAPREIETQITQKVEAAIRSINGVDEIQSTASEGSSNTFVQFTIGTNTIEAVSDVKNAVDQIRGSLPDGILEPQVSKVEIGGSGPIGYFAVSADDMTMEQLSWFIDDTVAKRLLGVSGMAAVSREGGVNREIRVVLDPARMQSLGVTASQVNATLRQVNVDAAGGKAEIAGSRQSVRVLGNADNAYQLSQTQISLPGGRSVRLSDVASVSDGFSERTSIAKMHGRQVVTFGIERAKGASDVTVYDGAVTEIAKLEKENPGVHFTLLYTSVKYTKDQYASSIEAMIEGAVLAIIVVFFFLRDWRATMISAIAIPLSAIPTFWFMSLMGFSLNSLSLLALSLVAGVLVDDAIVEIENIVRHMRMGKSAYQASIDAADEIGLAVVATTMCIVAVFLPVGMMPGISGQFFKNFGLTIVAAVLVSLAVARMITPMVAAYFLKAHGQESHGEGRLMDLYTRVLDWTLDTARAASIRAGLEPVRGRWYYYIVETLIVVIGIVAAMAASAGLSRLFALVKLPALVTIPLTLIAMIAAAFLAGSLVSRIIRATSGGLARYHAFLVSRIGARMRGDHRVWAFGIGILALALTFALLTNMPQQFQPTINDDSSR
ncbi:MAG: efflux RND transporter permease subunit, partial [Sphingomonadales bacterium]|nr:efflux RND transporter permease subunit [Sphingomonadales bacterium]